jgi:anti-sigma regulatory factor (Ser/Thr protein kinase)
MHLYNPYRFDWIKVPEKLYGYEWVTILNNKEGITGAYIDQIYFPDGLDFTTLPGEIIDSVLGYYTTKTFLPIITLPIEISHHSRATQNSIIKNRDKVLSTLVEIIKKQTSLEGELIRVLSYLIGELTTNMFEHSKSAQGIVMAQTYKEKGYIEIAFADNGKGLRKSYLENGIHTPGDDTEAINLALNGVSTKDDGRTRGYGISTTKNVLANGLTGRFFLWTGNSFNYHYGSRNDTTENKSMLYNGCFYSLKIPINAPSGFNFYSFVE